MTILFLDDWLKYPGAIVDTETPNKSFIRMAALYRDMGVRNHAFLLALHNPRLQGIDPFDPNLTLEQQLEIAIEAKDNFWYAIRSCLRTPDGTEDNPIYFKANRGNIALFWLFFNHITAMLIQPRQTGKSINTNALMTYLLNIRCTKTHINQINKDESLRGINLERLKQLDSELPFYLKQRTKRDIANTEELKISSLENSYESHLPSASPKQAYKVGRGHTSAIWHIEEAAFLTNIGITMPSALAAGTAAREIAKLKNEPYGTIITTTAGKKDDKDGKYIYDQLVNAAIWTEQFLDARDAAELEQMIRRNSPRGELKVNCTFSHRQLGYTDQWLKEALEATGSIGDDADRDFFNIWTSGTQSSPLPLDILTRIRESEVKDYYSEITPPHAYITRWFVTEQHISLHMKNSFHVMGIDSSDAAGGDDIGMHVRDIKTGATTAAGNYNETNLIAFAEWLCQWLMRYENLVLIIERRSSAATIIDYLLLMLPDRGIDPFKRLYNKVVQESDENKERFNEINKPLQHRRPDVYVKYKKTFGFATSANGTTSRTELYSTTMLKIMKMTADTVKDPILINQILGLVIRNNRVDHEINGSDDLCIGSLLTGWIIIHGRNLSFYGINSKDLLRQNQAVQQEVTTQMSYDNRYNDYIRQQIEGLLQQLNLEKDEYVCQNLEQQLKGLYPKLIKEDQQMFSVDDLINQIRSKRRSGRSHQSMFR